MEELSEQVRAEAAEWFGRMHGPESERFADGLNAWCAADPANGVAYRQLQQRWEQTKFIGNLGVVRDRDLDRAAVWPQRRAVHRAVAACTVLLALLVGVLLMTAMPQAAIAYQSGVGEQRHFVLPDSTQLTLDANSAVSIVGRRAHLVRGRARFVVHTSASDPILVDVGDTTVSAANTTFDVDLAPHAERIAIARGEAIVSSGHNVQAGKVWRLTGGQQIVPNAETAPGSIGSDAFAWTRGMLSLDAERLDDSIATFNRYNRRRIEISDPSIGSLKVTGGFHANDPLAFARAVATMFHLRLVEKSESIVLAPEK